MSLQPVPINDPVRFLKPFDCTLTTWVCMPATVKQPLLPYVPSLLITSECDPAENVPMPDLMQMAVMMLPAGAVTVVTGLVPGWLPDMKQPAGLSRPSRGSTPGS